MGCGGSRSREPSIVYGTGQLVHSSRKSYQDVPLLHMYKVIEDNLVAEIQEKRTNRHAATQRLIQARGAQGLQARGSLMSILSTPADVFATFLADCPEYVDGPTFGSNISNAIPGSFMLSKANELQEVIEGRGGGLLGSPVEPNATLRDAALENVLRFKALWGGRLLAVTLLTVEHPTLGRVALVQPLLLAACMQRVFNWIPEVDPVFEVFLQAGASPIGRNSLNMTALMLVATSLLAELESHTALSSCPGDELEGQVARIVAVAAATARRLLAAGADPVADMRGFGARWDAGSRAAALLPAPIRFARYVLHLERYTVQQAFKLMRRTLDEQIQSAGSSAVQYLDEFAALLLPPGAPGAAAAAAAGISGSCGSSIVLPGDIPPAFVAEMGRGNHDAGKPEVAVTGGCANGGDGGEGCGCSLETYEEAAAGSRKSSRSQVDLGPQRPLQQQGQQPPERRQQHQHSEQPRVQARIAARELTWPWIQAMSNIAWAVSQVAMVETAPARRIFLRHLVREAPFCLPPMTVVSVAQLLAEGCIPRYSRQRESGGPHQSTTSTSRPVYQPLTVDDLPPSAVVVFVSHRWLGRGSPDDDHRTKLKQVMAIAAHMSKCRGVPEKEVFLWLDYSVIDQDNPMPGVQALPIYIACCEEFVYIQHDEYWQRAWCLTEQFMHWKLATSGRKHVLNPHTLDLALENARERPPDPTYGKLAMEADRVALATMTSILPYEL